MAYEFNSIDIAVPQRDAAIPATAVLPKLPAGQKLPLVVMCHGFAGARHEGGGFALLAERLAQEGIATVRMDFAGCGDSKESAVHGSISDMAGDALACYGWMKRNYSIDEGRLGVVGNSMGGRVALEVLASGEYPARAALLMAPAARAGVPVTLFGSEAAFEAAKAEAEEKGSHHYTTFYGAEMELGPKWFDEVPNRNVYDRLKRFDGAMRVLYAEDDEVVEEEVCREVADTYGAEFVLVNGGGHTFGFYTGQDDVRERAVASAVEFLAKALA